MKLLIEQMEVEVKGNVSMLERRELNKKGSYFMICFVESLRGSEGSVMDAEVLRHHIGKGREGPLNNVVIPLMGIFKGYTCRRHHIQVVVNKRASKLKVRCWMEMLNNELIRKGQINGPA